MNLNGFLLKLKCFRIMEKLKTEKLEVYPQNPKFFHQQLPTSFKNPQKFSESTKTP